MNLIDKRIKELHEALSNLLIIRVQDTPKKLRLECEKLYTLTLKEVQIFKY